MNTKQLRLRILDRAIRGKLVPQDPTDEPASVLLERIRREKEELIKDKKLKREKRDIQPIEEVPFEIPEGWVWCRLGEILINRDGERQPLSSFVRSKQIKKIYDYYGATGVIDKVDNYIFDEKLLLVGEDGANLLSKVKPNAFFAEGKYWVNNHAHILDATNKNLLDYVIIVINTISLDNYITGSAQPKLSQDNLNKIPIPLPPLAEQHRIVEKIGQLLTITDTIEQLQEELKTLVKQAKSQVLSDAIAGKLTRQDSNDEPAEELLKRIGKTTAIDTPYEKLPKGWAWCKLGDLTEFIRNGISIKQDKGLKGYPITRIETISDGSINRERMGYADIYDLSKYEQYLLTKGDILLSHINSPIHIGKSAVYTPISDEEKIIHGMNLLCIRLKEVDSCFINYFFNSKTFRYSLFPFIKHAVNQASINIGNLRNIYIPLPPLAEQHRIVQQIEMYFAAFDQIENELT